MENVYSTAYLMGGLGNQMFQIAHAVCQGLKNNKESVFEPVSYTPMSQSKQTTHYVDNIFKNVKFVDKIINKKRVSEETWNKPNLNFSWDSNIEFYGYYQSLNNFFGYDEHVKKMFGPDNNFITMYGGNAGDSYYKYISFAAPYMDLIEEFTLAETVQFHARFKPLRNGMKVNDLIEVLKLKKALNKPLKYFSSGMKQRVKLGLALYSEVPLILLDEPTTNLDLEGADWYAEGINHLPATTLLVVASNTPSDYESFDHKIFIKDYKKKIKA
jgi:ABC-type sugar transport system ATPase subunit